MNCTLLTQQEDKGGDVSASLTPQLYVDNLTKR